MQNKERFEEYLFNNEIHSVAIYGMNVVGKKIYDKLLKVEAVRNVFGIEKLNYANPGSYKVYYLFNEEIPEVDAIIVIPDREIDFIKWELYNFVSDTCRILGVSELEWEE